QVVVDRLELMRERINSGYGEAEVRIELVGDAERVRLKAETQEPTIAVEGLGSIQDVEPFEISGGQRDLPEALSLNAHEPYRPASRPTPLDGLDTHRLAERCPTEDLPCPEVAMPALHRAPNLGCSSRSHRVGTAPPTSGTARPPSERKAPHQLSRMYSVA